MGCPYLPPPPPGLGTRPLVLAGPQHPPWPWPAQAGGGDGQGLRSPRHGLEPRSCSEPPWASCGAPVRYRRGGGLGVGRIPRPRTMAGNPGGAAVLSEPGWAWPETQRCRRGLPGRWSAPGCLWAGGELCKGHDLSGCLCQQTGWDGRGKKQGPRCGLSTPSPQLGEAAQGQGVMGPSGACGKPRPAPARGTAVVSSSRPPAAHGDTDLVWPGRPKLPEKPEMWVFM